MATSVMSLRSLAMAMADAASLPPAHKLLPQVSLPLISSRAAPLHLRANRRLPLAPLVASSDAVETGVEWAESGDEEAGDAFEEEVGEGEEEERKEGKKGREEGKEGERERKTLEVALNNIIFSSPSFGFVFLILF